MKIPLESGTGIVYFCDFGSDFIILMEEFITPKQECELEVPLVYKFLFYKKITR